MFATWTFHVAALVTAWVANAQYDALPDLSDYPEFERGLRMYRHRMHHHHHGGHHRHHLRAHHRHHKMALAHHSASPTLNWSPDDDAERRPRHSYDNAVLPGRYPSVEKALNGMSGDLNDLQDKRRAAKDARTELEGKVSETMQHMNDAMSIQHAISHKQAQLRVEKNQLRNLEREAAHMDETHTSLVDSLHRVLEPKIQYARQRLQKKEMMFEKEEKAARGWGEKKEQLHQHALEILKDKKVAHQSLLAAEHEVAEAKKREEEAQRKFDTERKRISQEITSFKYANTRFEAELTHEKAAKEAALAAKESVEKLDKVLEVESEKVEESMTVNKNRVHRKMEQLEAEREKETRELDDLEQKYREWQESQRQRAAEVVTKSQDTAAAAEAYADRQRQVLDSAQTKVVRDAEKKSDWAWDSDFSNDAGFTDSVPSLSD